MHQYSCFISKPQWFANAQYVQTTSNFFHKRVLTIFRPPLCGGRGIGCPLFISNTNANMLHKHQGTTLFVCVCVWVHFRCGTLYFNACYCCCCRGPCCVCVHMKIKIVDNCHFFRIAAVVVIVLSALLPRLLRLKPPTVVFSPGFPHCLSPSRVVAAATRN